jgi:hypothetical protein
MRKKDAKFAPKAIFLKLFLLFVEQVSTMRKVFFMAFLFCGCTHLWDAFLEDDETVAPRSRQNAFYSKEVPLDSDLAYDSKLSMGMSKDQVRRLYGKPFEVLIAGHPYAENERWQYSETLRETIDHRIIYFEAARVVGWE